MVKVGETFKVEIKADNLAYLLLAEYYLAYDAQLLEVVDDNLEEEGIQVTPGTFPTGNFLRFHLLNKPGEVHYGLGMMSRQGAFGGGVLSSITFRAKASGVVKLYFTPKTKFFDTGCRQITLETNSVQIHILGTPPPTNLADTLKNAYAYPNPSRTGEVTFAGLTENTTVRIYNIVGELVYEQGDFDDEPVWRCRNLAGERVASGIYIYVLTNDVGEIKKGKVGVIR